MNKDDSKQPPAPRATPVLSLLKGGRADLELEALLSIPYDFEKTKRIFRTLALPANSALTEVSPGSAVSADALPRVASHPEEL